ncbi:hypothetical protein [Saccharothrix hoggarensis]|uniref:Uncharacterized protein n=1 Tax=Saccharothrix hoggarensis TaxID=913853 RepID=A0ABW3QHR9_9PSEU
MHTDSTPEVQPVSPDRIFWSADRTPEEWAALAEGLRMAARGRHAAARESFDRCDTDGFLSQWAATSTAEKAELAAQLADAQGLWDFPALFNLAGELVSAREVQGRYGWSWVLDDEKHIAANGGSRWVNTSRSSNEATQAAYLRRKGYTQGVIRARGRVKATSGGGFSVHYWIGLVDPELTSYEVVRTAPEQA